MAPATTWISAGTSNRVLPVLDGESLTASGLQRAVAVLELAAGAAGTGLVAADLALAADERRGRRRLRRLVARAFRRHHGRRPGLRHLGREFRGRRVLQLHAALQAALALHLLALDLLLGADLQPLQQHHRVRAYAVEHRGEQLERLALVLLLRVLLRIGAQVNALAQVV